MRELINKHPKQDLTEMVEAYSTPGYVSQSVPMGDAIPSHITYTHASVEGALRRLHRKVLSSMYEPDDEYMKEYFNLMQDNYKEEVVDYIGELKRWRVEVRARKRHWPRREDYEEKRLELCQNLAVWASSFPIEKYFYGGADDTADAGAYLLSLPPDDKKGTKEHWGTLLLSGIQWLVRMRDALLVETSDATPQDTPPPTEEITYDEALKTLLVDYLKLNTKSTNVKIGERAWNKNRVIVATMHVLGGSSKASELSETDFSNRVGSIIDTPSHTLRKSINRIHQEIKPYHCNLKDLSEEYIKNHKCEDGGGASPREFRQRWEGLYELIVGFIKTQEDLAPLRTSCT